MQDSQHLTIDTKIVAYPSRSFPARLALAALILTIVPLGFGFLQYLNVLRDTIPYPYELDYGEGVVWQQMREIVAGHGYGRIDVFPSIVFNYPPLYHLLTAAFSGLSGLDQLSAGRTLSAIATIALAATIALIVSHIVKADRGGRYSWLCGAIAGLLVFSMMPVLHWSRFMRVDMLALFFSFSGLYFGLRAIGRPRTIHVAALCFVAAVFTKQTSLAAPIAVFATLLLLRPRTALSGITTGILTASLVLGYLAWQTNGGFIDHIILYNINRIEPGRLNWIVTMFGQHAIYIGIAAVGIWQVMSNRAAAYRQCDGFGEFRRALAGCPADFRSVMLVVYLLVATLMLLTIVKSGSTYNYFMEWLCLIALFTGLALADVARVAAGASAVGSTMLILALPLAVAAQAIVLPNVPQDSWRLAPARQVELNELSQMITTAPKPIISDDMVMLVRSGKTVQWEPAMYAELGVKHVWDERPFIAKIRNGDFAFFITRYTGSDPLHHACYNPQIAAAIASAYPVTRQIAGYTINLPRR